MSNENPAVPQHLFKSLGASALSILNGRREIKVSDENHHITAHVTAHATRRDEMLVEIGKQRAEVVMRIEQNKAAIFTAKRKAGEYSQWQRHSEAQHEMSCAAQFQNAITKDEAILRELDLHRENVVRGTHPELISLATAGTLKENGVRLENLASARADFVALLTPELRDAARRFVTAWTAVDPLAQIPHLGQLAEMISEGDAQLRLNKEIYNTATSPTTRTQAQ